MTARELYDTSPIFAGFIARWVEDRAAPLPFADWLEEQDTVRVTCQNCAGKGHHAYWRQTEKCSPCEGTGSVIDHSPDLLAEAVRWAAAFPMRPVYDPVPGEDPTPCGLFPAALESGRWYWCHPSPTCANGTALDSLDGTHFDTPADAILWLIGECVRLRAWEPKGVGA